MDGADSLQSRLIRALAKNCAITILAAQRIILMPIWQLEVDNEGDSVQRQSTQEEMEYGHFVE